MKCLETAKTQKIALFDRKIACSKIFDPATVNIFILKGVDLIDHTSIFLLRTINHYVTLIMCTLS